MSEQDDARAVIGRRRAALRKEVGLTQDGLAERAGISQPAVSRAEQGRPVEEETLRLIAAALGVSAKDYFEPEGYGNTSQPAVAAAGEPAAKVTP